LLSLYSPLASVSVVVCLLFVVFWEPQEILFWISLEFQEAEDTITSEYIMKLEVILLEIHQMVGIHTLDKFKNKNALSVLKLLQTNVVGFNKCNLHTHKFSTEMVPRSMELHLGWFIKSNLSK
jgi:hypothetical protein